MNPYSAPILSATFTAAAMFCAFLAVCRPHSATLRPEATAAAFAVLFAILAVRL